MLVTSSPPRAYDRKSGCPQPQAASLPARSRRKPLRWVVLAGLIGAFVLLQSRVPLASAVQIGADEGFEVSKATLCLHGHRLYSEVWNDQPPLHTWLVTEVLRYLEPGILGPRLVTTGFAAILLLCVYVVVWRASGLVAGAITGALLITSPGFLELSSSCMLEIPALATAIAGLGVLLVLPRTKWHAGEWLSGLLFGVAALMKLVPLYLLPLAALVVWLRQYEEGNRGIRGIRGRGKGEDSGRPSLRVFRLFRGAPVPCRNGWWGLLAPLLVLGAGVLTGFTVTDWLIERGAFLAHFQQTWSSHFGEAKSFEYGSPAEHAFKWSIFLKNWDTTVPALFGIWALVKRLRTSRMASLPLAWLALALLVFTNHKPWWAYYYIHIAIPLCWCAAVGIQCVCSTMAKRSGGLGAVSDRQRHVSLRTRLRAGVSALRWRALAKWAPVSMFGLCAAVWMEMRVYLEITGMRETPQLHAALVLKEIARLKPFCHWMYAEPLVYSFHADIPMPPTLAVLPLKRLWAGEMTNERIAAEMARYKPEVILLPNDTSEVPFQELLEANYGMVYEDDKLRLYADRAAIKQADSAQRSAVRLPQSVGDSKP